MVYLNFGDELLLDAVGTSDVDGQTSDLLARGTTKRFGPARTKHMDT